MFPTAGVSAPDDRGCRRALTGKHLLTVQTRLKQPEVRDFRECTMKLLIQSTMIFFGTLMAAVESVPAAPVDAFARGTGQDAAAAPRR